MSLYLIFITALRSLNKHKMRSLLTTLGIIIGIVSIVSVMSIGEGAKTKIQTTINKLGTNFIIVLGGSPKKHRRKGGGMSNLTLKKKDFESIIEECEDIALGSPAVIGSIKTIFEGKNWQTMLIGVTENYLNIRNWSLSNGENITEQDIRTNKKVALIGQTVYNEIFEKNTNPIGQTIRIKKLPFEIIGVLDEKGKTPDGQDQDDLIIVPVSTAKRKVLGIAENKFAMFLFSAKTESRMNQASNEIKAILRQQHKLRTDEEDDFTIFTQDDISKASDAASKVLGLLLLIIASISLIVGGIGIMNIMLVTVSERTREIGVRMALGATTKNILNQFILESIVICSFGSIVGIIIGIIASKLIGFGLGWATVISSNSLLISIISSLLIGVFFGYYPALKASRLNPVEALFDR